MIALALRPSLAAVTMAVPAATAVTRPVEVTVARSGRLDVQLTTRSSSTFPSASRVTAVSAADSPTASAAAPGVTDTLATGAGAGGGGAGSGSGSGSGTVRALS